jgi:Lrp/AsnC family transcriptional regulator for asnA, asnC and gidA
MYARNNHNLMEIIHDRLQPLGLSRSETIISFSTDIDRQLPILDDFEEEDDDLDDDENED